jgi:hypothetical protein
MVFVPFYDLITFFERFGDIFWVKRNTHIVRLEAEGVL